MLSMFRKRNRQLDMMEQAARLLSPEDLFELGKKISEETLSPNDEMYKYFHDESNLCPNNQNELDSSNES